MRKKLFDIAMILICLLLVVSITACSQGNVTPGGNEGDEGGEGNNSTIVNMVNERLKVSSIPETPELKYTYSDKGNFVYVFYIGQIYNVPISYGAAHYYDGTSDLEITYTNTFLTEETVASSKTSCISDTVSYTSEDTVSAEGSLAIGGKVDIPVRKIELSATFNVKTTSANKQSVSSGKTYSYSDVYESSVAYAKTSTESIKYVLGEKNAPNHYYRLTLFAQCDAYAFAVYNSEENNLSVSFDLSANPNTMYYALDKSADSSFPATNAYQDKLAFDTAILTNSALFDYKWSYAVHYELNGGTMEGNPDDVYTPNGINLPTPTKAYYSFGGWYLDSGLTKKANADDLASNPSDITLYAKWDTVIWTFAVGSDFRVEGGSGVFGKEGRFWILDRDYLEQYQRDGYKMQVTLNYEVYRNDGDLSHGSAKIVALKPDNNGNIDLSAGGAAYYIANSDFSVPKTHTMYKGTTTGRDDPEEYVGKRLGIVFECKTDDVGGGFLPGANDWYIVSGRTYIVITFVKA